MDADMENAALDKVKENPDDTIAKEYLEKLQNSNVILETFLDGSQPLLSFPDPDSDVGYKMTGTIGDKAVDIVFTQNKFSNMRDGVFDGREMTKEEVENVFSNYYDIAKQRMLKIQEIVKENSKKMEEEAVQKGSVA